MGVATSLVAVVMSSKPALGFQDDHENEAVVSWEEPWEDGLLMASPLGICVFQGKIGFGNCFQ